MAIFRNVHISFWSDTKITDDFTPEDKYFYLYLLTNPHTNICGCYEISIRNMSYEIGYNEETIRRLIERFQNYHRVIHYDPKTKEILLLNWGKYNWTDSPKLKKAVEKEIERVKSVKFKEWIECRLYGIDTVSDDERYGIYTTDTITITIPDTITDTDSIIEQEQSQNPQCPPVISITLNTKQEYPIYQTDIDKWKELYPAVDVLQELRKMKGWSDANPAKRKTKSGIKRFINSWLAREQDKGKTPAPTAIENNSRFSSSGISEEEMIRRLNGQ